MNTLIVVNKPQQWPFDIPGAEVVSARDYLTQPRYSSMKATRVYNLCRSYKYQSAGYYVSLLAEARGHKPLPSLSTIQDLKNPTIIRGAADELEDICQKSLSSLHSDQFILSVYFGKNLAKRYDRLSRQLYNQFPAPLLRAEFRRSPTDSVWTMTSVAPMAAGDIPENHREFVPQAAKEYFSGRKPLAPKKKAARYSMAILIDPTEKNPPSTQKALQRFERAGEQVGFEVEFITREDFGRIAEFDALFIRCTTSVNHFTYRFARKAEAEGLVVMDDPLSILRCTNKVYLAELMERNKIRIPRTVLLHKDNIESVPEELGFPMILKQPDSSFSLGVVKVEDIAEYREMASRLLGKSDLVVAQEFLPTDFDWRIGALDGEPLYACRYYMARKHWQIYKVGDGATQGCGKSETLPVELAPRAVVRAALKACELIGKGLYGVDLKEKQGTPYLIEVNDNPSIDDGIEDQILREGLYRRVMACFMKRVQQRKEGRLL